jgi:DNA-binding response OmpR family regulator
MKLPGKKVLLVDDEIMYREQYKDAFIKYGVEVLVAKDGIEALETIIVEQPDAVVVDLLLPRLSGLDLLKEVRSNHKIKGIPVIVYSAIEYPEVIKESYSSGATGYIVKGKLAVHEFLSQVETFLTTSF